MNTNLHQRLMQACEQGNVEDTKLCLDHGVDPNFNIKSPANALNTAIQKDHHEIITLLLEHGATVKEFVLQKAIEKDKNYLPLLIPHFAACRDEKLLMGALQAAINIGDVDLARQAIKQGAKPASLHLYAIGELNSAEILELLLENGFNIHADANKIFSQWMGSPAVDYKLRDEKLHLLAFVSDYYLNKPDDIAKFNASILDTIRLFRLGLDMNNLTMMKFSVLIGANKNEALNSALYRYYAGKRVDYDIIDYILNSDIIFEKVSISNAVCFKYTELLQALSHRHDLEYAYEMAYKYNDDHLCDYFIDRGVSKEAQNLAKMRVAAIKGDMKALRKAVNKGANVQVLDLDFIVEVLNENQVESLKYLYDSGLVVDVSLNSHLDKAMGYHEAFDTISYLIELGLDITSVKNMPQAYKKRYPALADMWQKRFRDIFHYTMYLAKEIYPRAEGKRKEEILRRISELSSLPYVIKMSKEKSHEH